MSKKIWIDAGHGGSASGATGCGRLEKDDTLLFALELDRQFREQGLTTVLTRTTDKYMALDSRTAIERKAVCDLAVSCHRNGAADKAANGFEVWLHSKAPQSYVQWARDIAEGMCTTGMEIRAGQAGAGVYKGFRGDPAADYYANSGTNCPSCLLELGFMGSARDNAIFDAAYKEMCAAVVKAGCKFLGVAYRPDGLSPPVSPADCSGCAALRMQLAEVAAERKALVGRLAQIALLAK